MLHLDTPQPEWEILEWVPEAQSPWVAAFLGCLGPVTAPQSHLIWYNSGSIILGELGSGQWGLWSPGGQTRAGWSEVAPLSLAL